VRHLSKPARITKCNYPNGIWNKVQIISKTPHYEVLFYPPVTSRLLYPHFLTSVAFTQHTALNLKIGMTSMAK